LLNLESFQCKKARLARMLQKHIAVPSLIAIIVLALLFVLMPERPIIDPDTSSYLDFNTERTAGYPLFLKLVGPSGALWVQPILFALALGFLGYQTSRLTGSALAASVLMLGIAMKSFTYHYTILTESLFVSLCLVLIGFLMKATIRPDWQTTSMAALVAGAATAVRPVGFFLLPMMIFLLLLLPMRSATHRLVMIMAALVPFFAVVAVEHMISTRAHGENTLFVTQLFAKAAMIDAPTLDQAIPSLSPAGQALARDFAPVRDLIAQAPDFDTEKFLTRHYEQCIEKRCSKTVAPDLNKQDMQQATWARIAANPLGYLGLTWRHYLSLWTISGHHSSPRTKAYLDQHRPLPFEQLVPVLSERPRVQTLVSMAEAPALALAAVTLCLALFGIICLLIGRVLPHVAVVATTTALGVHGGAFLTAMAAVGVPRYTLVLRPFLVTALVCAACWIVGATRPGRPDEIPAISY
jgi:hypothetical protein